MLNTLRRLGDTWIIKGFLMLLALSFAAWGISGYLSGASYGDAIKIGETSVSLQEIDRDYSSQRQMIERKTGGSVSANQLVQAGVPTQYLIRLLQETTLRQAAQDMGVTAPEKAMMASIKSSPIFQKNGTFDFDTYKRTLSTIGYTPTGYEEEQRRQLTIDMMALAFVPPKLPDALVKPQVERAKETLDVQTLKLTASSLKQRPTPTEADLKQEYAKNSQRYMKPEERDAVVLKIDATALAESLTPTQEDLEVYYDDNKSMLSEPEKRHVRQILLETKEEAEEVYAELQEGKDFTLLAQTKSKDNVSAAKGGDLGELTETNTLPVLSAAIFSLSKNEISEPVESPLGYHILEVTDITPEETPAFEDVKDRIRAAWASEEAEENYYELLEEVEDRLAGGDNLKEVAQSLNLKTEEYTNFSNANNYSLSASLQNALYQQEEGEPSEAIALADDTTAFVQVLKHTPATLKPFEQVENEVKTHWMTATVQKQLKELARQITQKAQSLPQAVQTVGATGTIKKVDGIKRISGNDSMPWLNTQAREALFVNGKNTAVIQPVAQENAVYVVQRLALHKQPATQEEIDAVSAQEARQMADNLSNEVISTRLSNIKLSYNLPLLQRVFGESFSHAYMPMAQEELD